MIEEKVCFLLVSVARPSVSLTTTGGGKQRVEGQGKKRSRGQKRERIEKRCEESDSHPTKGEVKKNNKEKWVNDTIPGLEICTGSKRNSD